MVYVTKEMMIQIIIGGNNLEQKINCQICTGIISKNNICPYDLITQSQNICAVWKEKLFSTLSYQSENSKSENGMNRQRKLICQDKEKQKC